jgi:Cu/Ag efflux protein CusF
VGHRAEGKIEDIDTKSGSLTIAHGPVAVIPALYALVKEYQLKKLTNL